MENRTRDRTGRAMMRIVTDRQFRSGIFLAAALITSLLPRVADAQQAWAVSPYRVRVWLALEPVPELASGWADDIPRAIARSSEATFGAAWQLTVESAPAVVAQILASDVDSMTVATLQTVQEDIMDASDKLMIVSVSIQRGGYLVRVRELDCKTHSWSATRTRLLRQSNRLAVTCAEEVVEAFTPVGMISRSLDKVVEISMRAGLLTGGADVGRLIPPAGSILRGVIRKNDRLGKLTKNGLQPIPWTLLRVESDAYGTVNCNMVSGLKNPFRSRSSRQVEKLALLVRPSFDSTTLRLQSKSEPEKGLAGYDIYYRLPDEKSTKFIDRSDWRGEIDVPRNDDEPIKIMYVKNGGRLLARLPIVPGFEQYTTADIVDDSQRLEAEGFLKGIQEQMIEVRARQQVYGLRIRKQIADKNLERAEELLDELRSLQTRDDLTRKMRDRQSDLTSPNRAIQSRIDKMFRDTRTLLQKHMTIGEVDKLRVELNEAKRQ